jgi:NDP-sugar pyrophosphorylase family protein
MHLGIQRWNERGEFDYAMDYFPWLLTQQGETGKRLRAKLFPEPFYWSDIGRPDQYLSTLHDIYEKNALFSLPEAPERYYNQGVIYWKNAREIADTSEFTAQGNVIMLPEPDPS